MNTGTSRLLINDFDFLPEKTALTVNGQGFEQGFFGSKPGSVMLFGVALGFAVGDFVGGEDHLTNPLSFVAKFAAEARDFKDITADTDDHGTMIIEFTLDLEVEADARPADHSP